MGTEYRRLDMHEPSYVDRFIAWMTPNRWSTLFGIIAAVCAYLLTQKDVELQPILTVTLGAILVALAVVRPPKGSGA
jgi:hypothetical protein